jgi:hypothetical protein
MRRTAKATTMDLDVAHLWVLHRGIWGEEVGTDDPAPPDPSTTRDDAVIGIGVAAIAIALSVLLGAI